MIPSLKEMCLDHLALTTYYNRETPKNFFVLIEGLTTQIMNKAFDIPQNVALINFLIMNSELNFYINIPCNKNLSQMIKIVIQQKPDFRVFIESNQCIRIAILHQKETLCEGYQKLSDYNIHPKKSYTIQLLFSSPNWVRDLSSKKSFTLKYDKNNHVIGI